MSLTYDILINVAVHMLLTYAYDVLINVAVFMLLTYDRLINVAVPMLLCLIQPNLDGSYEIIRGLLIEVQPQYTLYVRRISTATLINTP
jgi:hypothetical protein